MNSEMNGWAFGMMRFSIYTRQIPCMSKIWGEIARVFVLSAFTYSFLCFFRIYTLEDGTIYLLVCTPSSRQLKKYKIFVLPSFF